VKTRILVVEDEDTLRGVICQVLLEDGHEVVPASNGEEGLRLFKEGPFPLVITDVLLGTMTGLELLTEIKVVSPESLVVIMTSHASLDTAIEALRAGAYDFLTKPFDDIELILAVVRRAMNQINLIRDNQGLLQRLQRNASELEALNHQLLALANRDGLTGLYNHRYFREALESERARAVRYDRAFSLILLDIDDFKGFNDTHGHLMGDSLLKSLAAVLTRDCRRSTVVARYGGEEFVLLLPEIEPDGALSFAQRLRETVAEERFKDENGILLGRVTISLGVASFPKHAADTNRLIACADRAMYQAKRDGRNAVRSADDIQTKKEAAGGVK
jgi:diguanylate cyclase (GGDEF)-like protein